MAMNIVANNYPDEKIAERRTTGGRFDVA